MGHGVCETCRWWGEQQNDAPKDHGTCRAMPPRIVPEEGKQVRFGDDHERSGEGLMGVWPITYREDWCAAHNPKGTVTR